MKDCVNEIKQLKSTMDQMSKHFEGMQRNKIDTDTKLDSSFKELRDRMGSLETSSAEYLEKGQNHMKDALSRILRLEEEVFKLMNQNSGPNPPTGNSSPHPGTANFNIGSPLSAPPTKEQGWSNPPTSNPNNGFSNSGWTAQGGPSPFGPSNPPGIPMSNPGAAPQPSQTAPPTPSSWATAGAGTNQMPWNEKHWYVDQKAPKELRTFDGDIRFYDKWRLRVRYHFIATNMFYQNIFDLIEANPEPLTFRQLSQSHIQLLPNVNWVWLSNHLYGFIGKVFNDTMLGRMQTLAGGEEFNGFELWRAMHVEFRGGSAEMSCNERGFFIDFPKCEKHEDLQNHIVQWKKLQMEHGVGLPDAHLRHMFRGVLPDNVTEELKKLHATGQLQTWDLEYNHVYKEISRFNDSRLSKWNLQRLNESIKPKHSQKVNHVGSSEPRTDEQFEPPPMPDLASMQANVERMVAAAISRADRGRPSTKQTSSGSRSGSANSRNSEKPRYRSLPNPKFEGCWCCGEKGHTRAQCKEFARIKSDNGGRVPKGYKGAYEKHVEKLGKTTVAAVVTSEPEDHDETYLWPLIRAPPPPKTPTSNKYSALIDSDDDDDEADVVKALAQLSSNIQVGPKVPQSQRKKGRSGIDMTRIQAVAKKIRNGELTLPDIELESNDEYDCCWALVDTGAGVNCASKSQFPHAERVSAPEVQLTTAGGNLLPNQGAMKVTTTSQEGVVRERIFYDAPVDMPIISIAETSQEGTSGSNTLFRQRDGFIEDNATHERQHFVKRKGVYFMKIFVKKRPDASFGRPGLLP